MLCLPHENKNKLLLVDFESLDFANHDYKIIE
jgi:hypothetical protein